MGDRMAILRNTLILIASIIFTTHTYAESLLASLGSNYEYRLAVLSSKNKKTVAEEKAIAEIQEK